MMSRTPEKIIYKITPDMLKNYPVEGGDNVLKWKKVARYFIQCHNEIILENLKLIAKTTKLLCLLIPAYTNPQWSCLMMISDMLSTLQRDKFFSLARCNKATKARGTDRLLAIALGNFCSRSRVDCVKDFSPGISSG